MQVINQSLVDYISIEKSLSSDKKAILVAYKMFEIYI